MHLSCDEFDTFALSLVTTDTCFLFLLSITVHVRIYEKYSGQLIVGWTELPSECYGCYKFIFVYVCSRRLSRQGYERDC